MISGAELKEWGLPDGPVFKTALKVLNHPSCKLGKAKAENLVRALVADPEKFRGDAVGAPIAKELLIRAPTRATLLNANHCPLEIFGLSMIEQGALSQIYTAAKLPVAVRAALMPDAHEGYGLPIGGVLATDGAVIPYAVGVDIGCRMQMTVFDMPGDMAQGMKDRLANVIAASTVFGAGQDINIDVDHPVLSDSRFDDIHRLKQANLKHIARRQLGTSGGGNHFVEFGTLELKGFDGPKLAVLSHSGSRGMGNKIGLMYSEVAMLKCHLQGDAKRLSWLELSDPDGQEYWAAMELAGWYAEACHAVIHDRVRHELGVKALLTMQNHHNFAWKEKVDGKDVVVHRKGATPAGLGVRGLIPGSMSTPTYVVEGKGDPRSMCSSSHGAGRMMSRKAAKEKFTGSDMAENLEGAKVTLVGGGVDECSMAYKDITAVMAAQAELVDVVGVFLPVVVKMADEQAKPWEKE